MAYIHTCFNKGFFESENILNERIQALLFHLNPHNTLENVHMKGVLKLSYIIH